MDEREQLLLLRRKKNIRHVDIAKALNVSQSYISRYETGKRDMSTNLKSLYKQYILNH